MSEDQKHVLGRIEPQQIERRRFPRAPVDLQVQLGFPSVGEFLAAHATDISRGGLLLAVLGRVGANPLRVEDRITVRVTLGEGRTIEANARVVRVEGIQGPDRTASIGVEFVDLDAFSAQLIGATVDEALQEG